MIIKGTLKASNILFVREMGECFRLSIMSILLQCRV